MIDLGKSLDTYYMNLVIQFGYISMFMSIFPAAVTWGFIANLIMIILTEKAYSTIARRSLSIEMENIGTWNKIIEVMCFVSTFVNAMLNVYTSDSLRIDLERLNTEPLFVVIIIEHSIILLKYLLGTVIPDVPGAILKRLKNAKYLENMAKEKRNNLKRRKKLKEVYEKLTPMQKLKSKKFEDFMRDVTVKSLPLELFINKVTSKINLEGAKTKRKKSEGNFF